MSTVSTRLQQLRGLSTFKEAADRCGLTAGHWKNLEEGRNEPTTRTLRKIADGYSVSIDWLKFGRGPGPKMEFYVREEREEYLLRRLAPEDRRTVQALERFFHGADRDRKRSLKKILDAVLAEWQKKGVK